MRAGLCSSSSRKYPGTEGTDGTSIETITADMLKHGTNSIILIDVCRITKGVHLDNL